MISLDTHAHINIEINPKELSDIDACIVAVTRTFSEFKKARNRNDQNIVWALGAHPGVQEAHNNFDISIYNEFINDTPVIGEIGLDGRSKVPMGLQIKNYELILASIIRNPRIATIHSYEATSLVLCSLGKFKPDGIILHWWRGDKEETYQALELGCYFSINSAEVENPKIINILPKDRVLTETDHPFGDRKQFSPRRPGNVSRVENALSSIWGDNADIVRQQIWSNFRQLVIKTNTGGLFPHIFVKNILAAR
ncbi:MAG: TatD family hydrolase [Candidatus Thorarchaeota archaeon]